MTQTLPRVWRLGGLPFHMMLPHCSSLSQAHLTAGNPRFHSVMEFPLLDNGTAGLTQLQHNFITSSLPPPLSSLPHLLLTFSLRHIR